MLAKRTFVGAILAVVLAAIAMPDMSGPAVSADEESVGDSQSANAGLVRVEGKYIQLITDRTERESLHQFVAAFDQAVPLWLDYWKQDASSVDGWRLMGYLMEDKSAFKLRGLIPASLPEFANGYQSSDKLWVVAQPSDYYTLHLILHEGVHGLAHRLFGGAGPPWYMEGTAEFLATHVRGATGLQVGIIPANKESSPYWGRIGLIDRRRSEGKIPTIETVMRYGDVAHRDVEPYAWSWAAALLMEIYPEYREPFRSAASKGSDQSAQFTRALHQSLRQEWPVLAARWQLLCNDLEYGFEQERNRVALDPSVPVLGANAVALWLRADQGWQAIPARIRGGDTVEIKVSGQVQLDNDPAWRAEADGVTITYYRSNPLGRVVACVLPSSLTADPFLPKLQIFSIGAGAKVVAPDSGWLLLKVNDSPAQLGDNQGEFDVQVQLQRS